MLSCFVLLLVCSMTPETSFRMRKKEEIEEEGEQDGGNGVGH